jgi:glyoxylase-like metal-dependent hydrolase (beta-lactamase superfamily II)
MPRMPRSRSASIVPFLAAALALQLAACRSAPPPRAGAAPRSWQIGADLEVAELAPGVYRHTSWRVLPGGARFPSNGLIVREGDRLLLVDTAWGEEPTERLLGWIESELRSPVARAVVTHSHDDRLGGGAVLARHGIPFVAQPLTLRLAAAKGLPVPTAVDGLDAAGSAVRLGSAELFYPGPAHAPDNLMVWLPESRILFGGCAVRAAAARDLGNVADADLAGWPVAIRRALERYGEARIVVPGHGDPGGPELLRHTLTLFER